MEVWGGRASLPLRSAFWGGEGEERGWRWGPADWAFISAPGSRCLPRGAGGNGAASARRSSAPGRNRSPLSVPAPSPFRPGPHGEALDGAGGPRPLRRPPRRRGSSGAGGSGVRHTGRPLPQVTVLHHPQNLTARPTSVLVWLARQGPRVGPQKQLSLRVDTTADRGSGTLEETRGGSRRKAAARRAGSAARLGEPGGVPRNARPSQGPCPRGKMRLPLRNPGKCPEVSCARSDGPTDTSARPGGQDPRRAASPRLQPSVPSIPSTAKFSLSWKKRDRAGGAVGSQHSPRAPAGTPLYLQPRFSIAGTEGERGREPGAALLLPLSRLKTKQILI